MLDTSTYFFIGYLLLWVIPTGYLIHLSRRIRELEKRIVDQEGTGRG